MSTCTLVTKQLMYVDVKEVGQAHFVLTISTNVGTLISTSAQKARHVEIQKAHTTVTEVLNINILIRSRTLIPPGG